MSQPIKYASTKIPAVQSLGEIQAIVARYGASRFETRWNEDGSVWGIRFAIRSEVGDLPVALRATSDRIFEILWAARSSRSNKTRDEIQEQAERIAWRQLKDFVEQVLLAVETGLFDMAAAFMAHVEVWDESQQETVTMQQYLAAHSQVLSDGRGMKLLPSGGQSVG